MSNNIEIEDPFLPSGANMSGQGGLQKFVETYFIDIYGVVCAEKLLIENKVLPQKKLDFGAH